MTERKNFAATCEFGELNDSLLTNKIEAEVKIVHVKSEDVRNDG